MKTRLFFASLLLTGTLFAQTAQEFADKAEADVQRKSYKSALKSVDQAIALEPENLGFYYLKCNVHLLEGDAKEAFETLSKAEAIDPENAQTYERRGFILELMKMYPQAIDEYDKAIDRAENDSLKADYLSDRSIPKYNMRDFDGALEDLTMAYTLDSTNTAILSNIGMAYDRLGEWEKAVAYLEKALAIDPEMTELYSNIGFLYQRNGEHRKAIPFFDKSLELEENPYGYNNRAYSKLMLHDLKGAMKDVEKSISMYPANSYAYRNRALILLADKKDKKACEDLRKALELGFTEQYGPEVEQLLRDYCH